MRTRVRGEDIVLSEYSTQHGDVRRFLLTLSRVLDAEARREAFLDLSEPRTYPSEQIRGGSGRWFLNVLKRRSTKMVSATNGLRAVESVIVRTVQRRLVARGFEAWASSRRPFEPLEPRTRDANTNRWADRYKNSTRRYVHLYCVLHMRRGLSPKGKWS